MFKKCLLGILAICSLSANADTTQKTYKLEVKELNEKSVLSSLSAKVQIGKIVPIQVLKSNNEDASCDIKNENDYGVQELNIGTRKSEGVSVVIYPISMKNNIVKTIIVYDKVMYSNLNRDPNSIDINENCKFHNTSYALKNSYVQWTGDIKLNEETKIKLSDDENIFVKILE